MGNIEIAFEEKTPEKMSVKARKETYMPKSYTTLKKKKGPFLVALFWLQRLTAALGGNGILRLLAAFTAATSPFTVVLLRNQAIIIVGLSVIVW